jgi:hypothetical protein
VVAEEARAMIATWRGLAVAAAIAIALVITVVVDAARAPRAVDRALIPGFDPDRVTELVWERAGQPALRVVRDAAGWRMPPPAGGDAGPIADASAIGEVLSVLRGARWHRRGVATAVRTTLTIVAGGERWVLGIGEPLGADQTRIVVGERGAVVDDWVVRAIDREPLSLRIRAPLAEIAGARAIVIEREAAGVALRIEGRPRRLTGAAPLVLAAALAGELERALAQVTIVRLPDTPVSARGLAITAGADLGPTDRSAVRLTVGGSCPGAPPLVAVSGTAGDGCIEGAAAAAIERAIGALQQTPDAIVERRPVPFEVARVVLADGVALDTAPPRLAGAPADPARVEELLAVLAAPAEVVAAPARPAGRQLVVEGEHATVTLDLFADRTLARRGEPVALRLAPGAWNLLVRPSRELRDPALWLEQPTAISALRIDEVRYQRGAVIGAWTRQPAGGTAAPADGARLETLAEALAAPRAVGFLDGPIATSHRVLIEITPPAGPPGERVLELGAPQPAGCPARVERETVLLPAKLCVEIAALAK